MSTKLIHIVFFIFFLSIGNSSVYSQNEKKTDSLKLTPSALLKPNDSIKKDSVKKKKVFIEGIVKRKAKDYERLDQRKKQLTLYNQAELYYQDYEIKSGIIVLDYDKNEIYAGRLKDSTGKYTQYPYFKQGETVIEPDSIRYNTKTGKAKIWNSNTKQGEMFIHAEISKRENDSVLFFQKARFTTSENREDPEYYFLAYKSKFVPKKKFVTGLTHMYIYNVPTPIGVPFAFFPMSDKSTSGVIIPTPGQNNDRGYFLQNGGYYFALSDYYDLAILGDYYTNGSYALRAESMYAKKYKFNGSVQFRYENQVFGEKGFPNYSKTNLYNIQWSHSQDAKAAANSRFAASVNFGSSRYFRQSINIVNVGSNLNNTMSSSISYSKTIPTVPLINFSLAVTHNQNTNTRVVNLTLPTFNASVDRIFPFAKEDEIKKGVLENINFQYNIKGDNRINTTEDLLFTSGMFKEALSGISHSVPISTNFKLFNFFSVTTGVNYTENWVFNTFDRYYDSTTNTVVNKRNNGFDSYRTYGFSSGIGTTVYGTYTFKETNKIQAIRHILRPNISYGYTPSFEQYYDTYLDANGNPIDFSRFDGTLLGAPSKQIANAVGFALNNSLEAKVRDDENPKGESKKIFILNQFNFSTNYNFAATSFKLSPIRFTGGTQLFENKLGLNFGATFDPYDLNESGNRIDEYSISNGNGLVRMTSANISLNYNLSSRDFGADKDKEKDKAKQQNLQNGGREDDLFGRGADLSNNNQTLFEKKRDISQKELYQFQIPWDLRVAYSLTYANDRKEREITTNSLMLSGNIDLAVKWKMGFSSGYDFARNGLSYTQLRFERDLESWRMSFSIVPVGIYNYWNFFIGIKSSMLKDIKWDKQKLPDPRLR